MMGHLLDNFSIINTIINFHVIINYNYFNILHMAFASSHTKLKIMILSCISSVFKSNYRTRRRRYKHPPHTPPHTSEHAIGFRTDSDY